MAPLGLRQASSPKDLDELNSANNPKLLEADTSLGEL